MKYKIIIILLFLTSCIERQKPDFKMDINPNWNKSYNNSLIKTNYKNKKYRAYWWKDFDDEVLNYIVNVAIKNNPDFKIALSRIKESRANNISVDTKLMPEVTSKSFANFSKETTDKSIFLTRTKKHIALSQNTFDIDWEIDFFGVNKNLKEAEQHKLFATIANKNHFLTTLISDVAISYIEYRKYQALLAVNKNSIRSQEDIVNMMQARAESGLESDIKISEVKSVHISTKADKYELQYQIKQAQFRLEILSGVGIGELSDLLSQSLPIPTIKKQIIANSPLYIVQNRPDIIKAEEDLMKETSLSKSALSSQYPKLNLAAALGYQTSNFSPSQPVWNFGYSSVYPLFNFHRIESKIRASEERENQAFLQYKKTITKAFEEIELSSIKYISYYNKYIELDDLVKNNQRSLVLSKDLHESSLVSYIDVLEIKKRVYESEMRKVNSLAEVAKSSVMLHKALGYCV